MEPQRQLAQGFFQPLPGKPEVFPQQMGCIIPPVSLNVITGCVPQLDGPKDPSPAATEVGRLIR